MKKILLFLITTLLLVGCSKYINDISYEQIDNKIYNKESFIYYAGSDYCYNCDTLRKNIKKAHINVYYLDIDKLDIDTKESLRVLVTSKIDSSFYINHNYTSYEFALYTPAIYKYVNGELVSCYNEVLDKNELLDIYSFNIVDLEYYINYKSKLDNNDSFRILVYDDTNSENLEYISTLKKAYTNNIILYTLRYSMLTSLQKDELVLEYNKLNNTSYLFNDLGKKFELEYK